MKLAIHVEPAESAEEASLATARQTHSRFTIYVIGAIVSIIYLSVAAFTFRAGLFPVRPLFDGLAPPPPYRWVNPPPDFESSNEPALPGAKEIALTPGGSEADSVPTGDFQAVFTFPVNSIEPRSGETSVSVTITPLDPSTIETDDRDAALIEGNVYRVDARYTSSGARAALRLSGTISLRYPTFAHQVFRLENDRWEPLPTNVASGIFAVYAESDSLGVFAAGNPAPQRNYSTAIVITASIIAVASLMLLSFRFRKKRGG